MKPEIRQAEVRAEGNAIVGTAIQYGDRAEISPGIMETFLPGSLSWDDVLLNRQHDRRVALARTGGGGLVLTADERGVHFRAELPDTQDARDTRALVASGVLRGASIEFHALSERMEADVRVIEAARLSGIAVVDSAAYQGSSVQARARFNPWIRAQWTARKAGRCECQGDDIEAVSFEANAFTESIASNREILAVAGSFDKALASRKAGTLRLTGDEGGGLVIELDEVASRTPSGADLAGTMKAVPITARPILDNDQSTFTDADGVRTFSKAHLRAVLIKPTDNSDGWDPVVLVKPKQRRFRFHTIGERRVWL